MIIGELRRSELSLSLESTKSFHRIVLLNGMYDRLDTLRNPFEVHSWNINLWQAEFFGILHEEVHPRRSDDRFAGNTAELNTVTAQVFLLLDEKCLCPLLRRPRCDRQSSASAPRIVIS